jgi:hypothetical protein
MSLLSLVLFVHVASAMVVCVGLALEGVVLQQLWVADDCAPARRAVLAFHRLRVIYLPTFLGILLGGGYLAYRYGSGTGWIPASLVATLGMMVIGGTVTGRRFARLRQALAAVADPATWASLRLEMKSAVLMNVYGLRVGLTLGIVFLMTVQPELAPSLVALVSAAILGTSVTMLATSRARTTPHVERHGPRE